MKPATTHRQASTHSELFGDRRPAWHAINQRFSSLCFSVTQWAERSHATGATNITLVIPHASILKSTALIRPLESSRSGTRGRRTGSSLLLCLLVLWQILPILPLLCRSVFVSRAVSSKRERSEKALFPNAPFAPFSCIPFANETVPEKRPYARLLHKRSSTQREREHVQPCRQHALPFSYILSSEIPADQPLPPRPLEQYERIQDNLWKPAELSPRLYSQGKRPHVSNGSQGGTNNVTLATRLPLRSTSQPVHLMPSSFFSRKYSASSARQISTFPRQSVSFSSSKHKNEQVSPPWNVYFGMTASPLGNFEPSHEANVGRSRAKEFSLPCREGAYMSQLALLHRPVHTATVARSPRSRVTHRDLNGRKVLSPCATCVPSAFVGVNDEEEEEEEEDNVTESKERSAAPKGRDGAVSGQNKTTEDEEDEDSEEEDASEKEHEVEVAEDKEEKEEQKAEKAKDAKEHASTAKPDVRAEGNEEEEEEKEESKSEHEGAEAGKKTVEARHREGLTESKAAAERPATAHTLIKKKPPDYVPSWATRLSKKTDHVSKKPAEGAVGPLTEKPLVLHSALKPVAKIYYRPHHEKETSKNGVHKEKPEKEEKPETATREEQTSEIGKRSVKQDEHDARTHHTAKGMHKNEEKTYQKDAEGQRTATETHKEGKAEATDTQVEHPNPPVVLHGQPVVTGSAVPAVSGLPLQAQQMVQGAPAVMYAAVPGTGLPNAPSSPTPAPAGSVPVQLSTVPGTVPSVAAAAPTASTPIAAAPVTPTADNLSTAPVPGAGVPTVGLAAGAQPSSPVSIPVATPSAGNLPPISARAWPQGNTDAATAAAVQKAVLNTAIADEALREQMQKNLLAAIAQEQKAEQEQREQWSTEGIASVILLSVLGIAGVAGGVYYFYDKITRSIQRMRRKYAEVLETRRRERKMRRKEEEAEVEESDTSEEAEESTARARKDTAKPHNFRGSSFNR